MITISGGEPLMHPELDDVIRRIRANGMIAGMITNGYLLVPERIRAAEPGGTRMAADLDRQRQSG